MPKCTKFLCRAGRESTSLGITGVDPFDLCAEIRYTLYEETVMLGKCDSFLNYLQCLKIKNANI